MKFRIAKEIVYAHQTTNQATHPTQPTVFSRKSFKSLSLAGSVGGFKAPPLCAICGIFFPEMSLLDTIRIWEKSAGLFSSGSRTYL